MIILDLPYVSKELKGYILESETLVLKNQFAIDSFEQYLGENKANLITEEQFAQMARDQRIYTCSENSIEWIIKNIEDPQLHQSINIMKDKALFRTCLAQVYPDFFFQQVSLEQLSTLDVSKFTYPFILKPTVGFFSVGVYSITNKKEWDSAVADLMQKASKWEKVYPKSVVNTEFILEQYIFGDEFAIDAYYDENGEAVVLNILKHEFVDVSDVSDRLYYTGKEIIELHLETITKWLTDINQYFGIRNFPFHAEVRVDQGIIIPIEFNPLRFAGWCCTDISYFAYGFYTYDYYLHNQKPNWDELLNGKDGKYYTLIVMNMSKEAECGLTFDYEKACNKLGIVHSLRKSDYSQNGTFGFVFTEIEQSDREKRKFILEVDFNQFLAK